MRLPFSFISASIDAAKELTMQQASTMSLPFQVVVIDGAPWFHLRDILKATDHRPFFIRNNLLSLDGLRKFLNRSDKPLAKVLLIRIETMFLRAH